MKFSVLSAITLASTLVDGYVVAPPGPVLPSTITTCSGWHLAVTGDSCVSIETAVGITAAKFILYNPLAGTTTSCSIVAGFAYCTSVAAVSTSSSSSLISRSGIPTTLTTVTTTTSTSSGDGVSTPAPIQTGMVATCNSFYLVVSGDTCSAIATAHSISLANFYAWNPAVGSTCAYLGLGDYVCIGIIGGATSTSTSVSTTGDGVSTPAPIQTGMVATCNSFYLVVSGDTCSAIATAHSISLANFYAWNPAVGSTCAYLGLGDYVCIGIIGGTTTTTTTTGDGVSTPSPIQTGMVATCNSFYLVVSGDTCAAIASAKGVSLANFYAWNPAVGFTCAYLGLGDYVCIGIIGGTTTTTTTTGDGVSTPLPIQTGMTATCDSFYLVVSGDTCAAIASAKGITLANFYAWNPAVGSTCAYLGLGDYVCIGVL